MDYWNSTTAVTGTGRAVDAVLLPVAPTAAVITDKYMYYGYTNTGNLLDYSSATVPVTFADEALDPFNKNYQPLNDLDKQNWEAYDPAIYHGAPVGIQIMARRHQKERLLVITKVVVDALDASKETSDSTVTNYPVKLRVAHTYH